MESAFLPPDAVLLARQADLCRRLAAVARSRESADRLAALAAACAEKAAAVGGKGRA